MSDPRVHDLHISDLVVGPEETLALIRPHLPCACANCTAVTLMMAAGLALGQHYEPSKVGHIWRQVTLAGEKIAEITAVLRAHRGATLEPHEADRLATRREDLPKCEAFRIRGAH